MQKKNAGEGIGPSIPDSVSKSQARNTSSKCASSTSKCCWYGDKTSHKTGNKDGDTNNPACSTTPSSWGVSSGKSAFDYDGCSRTVCNYAAASYICSSAGWELPGSAEFSAIINIIIQEPSSKTGSTNVQIQRFAGASGLQLCQTFQRAATYGSAKCMDTTAKTVCNGSIDGNCYPAEVWGAGVTLVFDSTNLSTTTTSGNYARSVRCVLKKYK